MTHSIRKLFEALCRGPRPFINYVGGGVNPFDETCTYTFGPPVQPTGRAERSSCPHYPHLLSCPAV